jgi:carbon-monoxide dehydrogenase small subunit
MVYDLLPASGQASAYAGAHPSSPGAQSEEDAVTAVARTRNGDPRQNHSPKERFMKISMTVNGKPVSAEVETRTLLVSFIRENLRLTGTHVGCDTSQCGACTIHMNGQAVKSCNILAMQAEGADILTIEGLAKADGTLHPMQEAFREHHGLQCGFCTPGMVMSAVDLVKNHPNPSEETIRAELDGNLCRCTGYHNIVKAVKAASANM